MKMLHVIGSLDPVFGGPQEAVKQLASALSELGHQVELLTLDDKDIHFSNKKEITIHALGPCFGKYRFTIRLIPWLLKNAKRFDVVICHGIWQYQSLAIWLASRIAKFQYFIFVHGALDPWFRYAYPLKHIKKWLYWPWAEYQVLRSAKAVIYTSDDEKKQAGKSFCLYDANEIVIHSGIDIPAGNPELQKKAFLQVYPLLQGKQLLLFLSRIHPIKGCDLLIDAFAEIMSTDPLLHLVIAGPDETNWVPELQHRAQELGITNQITWTGMLTGDLKWGAYHAASCFVLPSHSENFGVVVAEALACSVPVIITDKVNIWREIENWKAGFVGTDTVAGIVNSLQQWLSLSEIELAKMKERAKQCFLDNFQISNNSKVFIEMIKSELNK